MKQELPRKFPRPVLEKNDKTARILIWSVSVIVFAAVAFLSGIKLNVKLSFDPHVFAEFNAIVNSCVAVLLVAALVAVRKKHYLLHKKIMIAAIILSVLFLVSYICHHLLSGETRFGDLNHDGILSPDEKATCRFTSLCVLCYFDHPYSFGRNYTSFYFVHGLSCTVRRL